MKYDPTDPTHGAIYPPEIWNRTTINESHTVSQKLYPTADGQQKEAPELTALDVLALPADLRLSLELDLKERIAARTARDPDGLRPGQLKEAIDFHFADVFSKWKSGELEVKPIPPVMIVTKQWEHDGKTWHEHEVTTYLHSVRSLDDGTLELVGFP